MRLIRFLGSGIHGFIKLNIKFNSDLTFITGINGSGKTSALNAIVALISPNLYTLAKLQFHEISVELINDDKHITVSANTTDNAILLHASSAVEPFLFVKYGLDPDLPPTRQLEAEYDHYRELFSANANHPVLKAIADLPTPMFLGLDRRARFEEDITKTSRLLTPRSIRSSRNVFATSLSRSLSDAEELRATNYRDALILSGQIAEELQQELLLSLLSVDMGDRGNPLVPTSRIPSFFLRDLDLLRLARIHEQVAATRPLGQRRARCSILAIVLNSFVII